MTVVPRESVMVCMPLVGHGLARCKGTLSETDDTVHLVGVVLSHTVPMDGRSVSGHGVSNVNDHLITPACSELRSRELTVDAESLTLDAIRSHSTLGQDKAVLDSVASLGHNLSDIVVDGVTAVFVGTRLTLTANASSSGGRLSRTSSSVGSNGVAARDTSIVVEVIRGRGRACSQSRAGSIGVFASRSRNAARGTSADGRGGQWHARGRVGRRGEDSRGEARGQVVASGRRDSRVQGGTSSRA